VLYNFAGAPGDGATPLGGVALARSGVLYGTTESGGTGTNNQCESGCGTVFSLTPPASSGGAWAETVLFNLGGRSGTQANTTPVIGSTGMLFGTTYNAYAREDGSVFSLRP
jgi:hypothetical protein